MRCRLLLILAACFAIGQPALAQEGWRYTDGSGQTVTLDEVPIRIIAHAKAAAALIPLGIRPVGIYVDSPVAEDASLRGPDLTGIEIVGEAWGEIDIEKAAALRPELIISEWWPLDKAWSGLEANADAKSKQILQLAPVTGVTQGTSIVAMIEDYEALAESLGADLGDTAIAADKAEFEAALGRFKAALAAKPDLSVMAVWAGTDGLYAPIPPGRPSSRTLSAGACNWSIPRWPTTAATGRR
jgi:iron complex transport system substrate-binding protein